METEGESVLVPFFTKLVNHRTNNQGTVCFDSLLLLLVSFFIVVSAWMPSSSG